MNPVERRRSRASHPFRDRLVREQHEILDQPVGVVSFAVAGVQKIPVGVGGHHRFGQVEVHGAAFSAGPGEQRGGAPHGPDGGPDRSGIRTGEKTGSILVGQPGGAPDHTAVEAGVLQQPVGADAQDRGLGQPVHVREEGADPGRQGLRQHRHGPLGKVRRGPAPGGLLVHRSSRRDVVAHVGDVNADFEAAAGQLPRFDGVVVVPRVFGIHGQDQTAAKVLPPLDLAGRDRRRRGLGLRERRGWELVPNPVFRKDRAQFRPRLVGGAEHRGDLSDDRPSRSGETPDAHLHEISGAGAAGGNQDLARPLAVPDGDGSLGRDQADDIGGPPADDPDDRALQPAAPGAERRLHLHQVPGQGATQPAAGDVDVLTCPGTLGNDPSITRRTALEPPLDNAG